MYGKYFQLGIIFFSFLLKLIKNIISMPLFQLRCMEISVLKSRVTFSFVIKYSKYVFTSMKGKFQLNNSHSFNNAVMEGEWLYYHIKIPPLGLMHWIIPLQKSSSHEINLDFYVIYSDSDFVTVTNFWTSKVEKSNNILLS